MTRLRSIAAALLMASLPFAAAAPGAQLFKVRYRALATVYVAAGQDHGLRPGDRLRVVSGQTTIAEMEVVQAYPDSVACRVLSSRRAVVAGDVVIPAKRAANDGTRSPAPPANKESNGATFSPSGAEVPPPSKPPAAAPAPTRSPSPAPAPTPAPVPAPRVAAATAPAATPAARRDAFRVKYRSASNAYLDAGGPAGLGVGDRLRVVSGKDTVAEIEVVYLSEQSASCRIVSETRAVRVGDTVVRVSAIARPEPSNDNAMRASTPSAVPKDPGAAPSPDPSRTASPLASAVSPRHGSWAHLRGAASVGYARSWDNTAFALGYEQRTARVDLGLYDIAGQPLTLTLRLRSRQDVRSRALSPRTPREERNDRLYELALRYETQSDRVGLELGRIGVNRFAGIGHLDGGLARYQVLQRLELGGFAGRDAEMYGFTLEAPGTKYGAFVRTAPSGRYATGGYDATLALVRETSGGDVSREYLSLESRFTRARVSLTERAELDLNRGWRQEATGKTRQLSNIALSASLRLSSSASAFAAYDGRRNYRYQRNRLVPEELFDNLLYQGLRAGLNVTRPGGLGLTLGGGMSLREPDPRHPELNLANAYYGNAGLRHASVLRSGLSIGVDGSGFSNGYTNGGLASAHVGHRFAAGHFVDLSYGRSLYRLRLTGEDRVTEWQRLTGRLELGRRLYLVADGERTSGDDLDGLRAFVELGVVF